MLVMTIRMSDESTRQELARLSESGKLVWLSEGEIEVSAMPMGTDTGQPAVGFTFKIPGGKTAFAMTSMRLFLVAADAMRMRYGDRLKQR